MKVKRANKSFVHPKNLGKQDFSYDAQALFEPITKTDENTNKTAA